MRPFCRELRNTARRHGLPRQRPRQGFGEGAQHEQDHHHPVARPPAKRSPITTLAVADRLRRHHPACRSTPVTPGWNKGALGFSPSFAPRRPGAGQRTSGRGQAIEHGPGTTAQLTSVDLQSDSPLVSCDIASHRATQVRRRDRRGACRATEGGVWDGRWGDEPVAPPSSGFLLGTWGFGATRLQGGPDEHCA
jgi:hypothetical protein